MEFQPEQAEHPTIDAIRNHQYELTIKGFRAALSAKAEIDTLGQPLEFGAFQRTKARQDCMHFEDVFESTETPETAGHKLDGLAEEAAKKIIKKFERSAEQSPTTLAYLHAEHMYTFNEYFRETGSTARELEALYWYQGKLTTLMGRQLALLLYNNPQAEGALAALDTHARIGATDPRAPTRAFAMKIFEVSRETREHLGLFEIFAATESMSGSDLEVLRAENDSLWQESRSLREYGVKSAITPSGVEGMNQWLVRSGFEYKEDLQHINSTLAKNINSTPTSVKIERLHAGGSVLAEFMGTSTEFSTSHVEVENLEFEGHILGLTSKNSHAKKNEDGTSPKSARILLHADGHLYSRSNYPLTKLCEALGYPQVYEQLRAAVLALHYDLVVPVHIQRIASDRQRAFIEANPHAHTPTKLQNLIVQRRKILTTHRDAIVDGIKEEQRLMKQMKPVAGHVVTGHCYHLPEGFKASLETRKLALLEIGKVLADSGEGYQRYHRRGDPTISPGPGHKTSKR